MNELIKCLRNRNYVAGVFVDFTKVSDTVHHTILLVRMCNCGICRSALDWLNSYFTNRKKFVAYNNERSELTNVNCGLPQGSIFGHLLYIYIY